MMMMMMIMMLLIIRIYNTIVGRDISGGTPTRYGLDGPGIESRWSEIFHTRPNQL
jgi:hypothetical protein